MTRDLLPCQVASGLGRPIRPPHEDHALAGRTSQGTRAQAGEPPEGLQPKGPPHRLQALGSPLGKGGGPRAPAGRGPCQARALPAGRADSSPPRPCSLDETPAGPRPGPAELSFQEHALAFTSSNFTSADAAPGPPPLRAPQSRSASPGLPGPYPDFQVSGPHPWPAAADDSFPGANFRVPAAEREPFPEGSRPHSPGLVPFPCPFPEDTARHEYGDRAPGFPFHQPPGVWPQEAVGTGPAYPPPSQPAPLPRPCYPGQPGGLDAPSDLCGVLAPSGAAHLTPSPFPDSLHRSLTKVLPERPASAHDALGSPGRPPDPPPQGHFPGQAYRASRVGTSPGPLDSELATPGPPAARLPQLWEPATAPYPTPALPPPATARSTFYEGQPSPGQGLCLPQSPPMPWPQVLPTTRPSPHQRDVLSRPPFPGTGPEWQGGSQGAPGAASKTPGPGEKPAGGPPGLFAYNGLKDPVAQPLFFGGAQPQASPCGTPSLPPPRVVGASPAESPLPSPATHTAGSSTCSSLSPPSSSPANPSSEEGQLPGALGPSAFFHPHSHPQEAGSPFLSPEPSQALPTHYQPEPAKAFAFPADRLGAEGPFECLGEAPFPQEPPPYPAHHFPLSSASLDQLDVLLTCRQCDRNYSSLAAFLAHRQFCGLPLARAKDNPQLPPGLAAPSGAPKAPADVHTGLLQHAKAIPFLLAAEVQADSRDDPLRTSFLPSLTAAPFPLPGPELDMEDEAKLDSLITEALNGMEYQSDTPEIDSSFIDVFADEEPSGPRGAGAGLAPKTRVGAAPENRAQPLPPATGAPPEPHAPCPGDRACSAQSRPKTRSLGLAPSEADASSLVRQQRRGKRLHLFRKELDTASTSKGPGRHAGATRQRPRRKSHRAKRPPPHPRDLRTQAPKGHADPDSRVPRAETRSSRRLRLPPRRGSRQRKARGGTWNKELIHKIVQQKNKRQAPGGRSRERGCASESEDDERPLRGPGLRGRRWRRGPKRGDLTEGGKEGGTPSPEQPRPGPSGSPAARGPAQNQDTEEARGLPHRPPQVPTDPKTSEEKVPSPGVPREARKPEVAQGLPPDSAGCGEGSSSFASPGTSPGLPHPEQPWTSSSPKPPGSSRSAAARGAPQGPTPSVSVLKDSNLDCDRALNGRPAGSLPCSSLASELLLGATDLAGCFPADLCPRPSVADALCQDISDASALEPKPQGDPPYMGVVDPRTAESPLTLESTSLFLELPLDGFDAPPLNDHLSASQDPPPKKQPAEPLCHPLLLLEEGAPSLHVHSPELSRGKTLGQKCPREGSAAPRLCPVPGKRSSVSADELEIKRLVTELESELQRGRGPHRAPGDPRAARRSDPEQPPCQAGSPLGGMGPGDSSAPSASGEGARGSPREWSPPAPIHAGLAPGPHRDLSLQHRARASNVEVDCGVAPEACLPDPGEQREPLLDAGSSAQRSPCHELLPQNAKSTRTQENGNSPRPLPGPGRSPEPQLADGRPSAHLAPNLARHDGRALDAISPPGTSHTDASQEHPAGRIQGPKDTRLLPTMAEGPGLEGNASATAGPSLTTALEDREAQFVPAPSPASVHSVTPAEGSRTPASSPFRDAQLQGPEAAEGRDCVWRSRRPPPASPSGQPGGKFSEQGGDSVEGGVVAASPTLEGQLGPEEGGHPSQQPSGHWGIPERPANLTTGHAGPGAALARPAGVVPEGGRAVTGPWEELWPIPSPTSPAGDPSVPVLSVAHTQNRPDDGTQGQVASPGLSTQQLQTIESPAPPARDLAQEHPGASGELSSPQHLPACSAQAPPAGASCIQAPTAPEAPPALATSLCDPPLEHSSRPGDPPTGQPGLSSDSSPARGGGSPEGSTLRTLEKSRKERLGGSPTSATPPPPGGAISPGLPLQAAGLSSLPTNHETDTARLPGAHCRGAPPHPSPDGTPTGSSTGPPHDASCTLGAAGPASHTCQEGEAGAGREGQGPPEAARLGVTEVLRASCKPDTPQSPRKVPHQAPQGAPISPQDCRQRPRGFKRKPKPTESSQSGCRAPDAGAVTCSTCSATFRSGPGLSRHRARKHGLLQGAASQPSPAALAQPGASTAQAGRPPGRKSRNTPGKERLRHPEADPSHTAGPAPGPRSPAPENALGPGSSQPARRGSGGLKTPGPPSNPQLQPRALTEQEVHSGALAPKPKRPDQLEGDKGQPRQAEPREGRGRGQEPRGSPTSCQGASKRTVGRLSRRRLRGASAPAVSAAPASHRRAPSPPTASAKDVATPGLCLSPEERREADVGPRVTGDVAETGPGAPCVEEARVQKPPGGGRSRAGRLEGASPRQQLSGPKGASARGLRGPRETRAPGACPEPLQAVRTGPAEDGGPGDSLQPASAPHSPPETPGSSCLQGLLDSSEAQGGPEGPEGAAQLSPGAPRGLCDEDDDQSFARLFPVGGRWTRKKNRRVYGKRGEKPKRLPWPEPSSATGAGATPPCASLPTDLSDSGSLCLSHEDPWDDEAPGLPGPFLLDGFLSGQPPSIESWAPGLSLWALEPDKGDGYTDDGSEAIPELHMVPVAWRGPEPQAAPGEVSSDPGASSPEPPSLEREHCEAGPPGTAGRPLPRLQALDVDVFCTKFEMQDLCFQGPCEDAAGPRSLSLTELAPETTGKGTPAEASGAGRAAGGEPPAKGKRASHKCRVCFQRFHGLRALDLHRLAHSAAPPPTCYMCVERRFGSRQLLREHLQEKHVQGRAGPWACGMCLKEVAGVWMYNEHLREHAVRFARQGRARRAGPRLLHGPHEGERAAGQAGHSAAEPPAREGPGGRERSRPRVRADGSAGTAPGPPPAPCPPCPGRGPPLPVESVHEHCRDPSRDCHHCGKRFPKPFKLQRHLAVHSPQRVYLCPRCPRVYREPRELRAHLGGAHGEPGAAEPPHTPLYTCELCADVLHVIKRSFVCSACNYTFAKKEQFERHMDKHLRRGQQPFAVRRVRRPGVPEASPSRKRRRGPGPEGEDRAPSPGRPAASEGALPAQAPGSTEGTPAEPLPPFPGVPVDSGGGLEPDRALEGPEGEASPGGPGPLQDLERRRAPRGFSGKHSTLGPHGGCAPGHSPGGLSVPQKEKQASTGLTAPERAVGRPSHKGSATKSGGCHSAPKDRPVMSTPSTGPGFPGHPRKAAGVPAPREPAQGTEGRLKLPSPKARLGPSSQGSGGPRPGTKTGGGSQPQPASGQLQSETATTPAKPDSPGHIPAPDKPAPAQPRGCTEGARGSSGCGEKAESSEKRKSQAPGPTRSEGAGRGAGGRAPRKQAVPSRVLPVQPRPGSQGGKERPQPSDRLKGEPGHVPGKARPLKRGRAVHRAEPPGPRDHRTAESQSDLLSQLFGQRITSFKIPLKRDTCE